MNTKTVKIIIPDHRTLAILEATPTLNRLSRLKLTVGVNTENVNHAQYSDMLRLYPLIGVSVYSI